MQTEGRAIGVEELKRLELDILIDFDKACRALGLRYGLCGGTLLGAVRHKGFIPWDDDVDVLMPRPDYMRFIEAAPGNLPKHLELLTQYNRPGYTYLFGKIVDRRTVLDESRFNGVELGVNIDVFPVDGLPADKAFSDRHFRRMGRLHALRSLSTVRKLRGRSFVRTMGKAPTVLFARLMGTRYWLRRMDRLMRRYDFERSEYVAAISSGNYGPRERIDRASFETFIPMEFEGREFQAPAGYDRYLTNLYGDYMTPPPEDKRESKHLLEAAWKREGEGKA